MLNVLKPQPRHPRNELRGILGLTYLFFHASLTFISNVFAYNIFGVAEVAVAIWTKRSEVGNPGLGDVAATNFDLFPIVPHGRAGLEGLLPSLSWRGDNAELLHHAQVVHLGPFFHDLAALRCARCRSLSPSPAYR